MARKPHNFDEACYRKADGRAYDNPTSRLRQERISQILVLIDQQTFSTARELAAQLGVHEATVSRDLKFIRRVKGEFWQMTGCEMRANSFKWQNGARGHYSSRSNEITAVLPYRPELPSSILARWSEDTVVEQLLGWYWNFVYRIRIWERVYALRLTSGSKRPKSMLLAELDWVNYLSQKGVSVCAPIRSRTGELVETVVDDDQTFYASVFEWAEGRRIEPEDCFKANTEFFISWGKLVGRMHALTREYKPQTDRARRLWDDSGLVRKSDSLLKGVPPSTSQICREVLKWAASLPVDSECFGLIHADLHGGNVRIAGDDFVVFDFDECSYCWFGYDLACAINWAFPPEHAGKNQALTAMLEGYEQEHAMSREWKRRIPGMILLRRVIIYLTMRRELSTRPPYDEKLQVDLKLFEKEFLSTRLELC